MTNEAAVAKAGSMGLRLQVTSKTVAAEGVARLELRFPNGARLPLWTPGAHVALTLEPGIVRQYSLCGNREDRESYVVAVLREADGRGGSEYVHSHLEVGESVPVSVPRNNFELREADRYLFVAGGIGVTPILPMIAEVDARGCDWRLVYGGKSRAAMAFVEDLIGRYGDRVDVRPHDVMGILPVGQIVENVDDETLIYACGPAPLLESLAAECQRAGVADRLEIERFTAAPDAAGRADDCAFRVMLQASRVELDVPPQKSILEAIEDAGLAVDSSCREGTCGTCETGVIEGVPDHRDALLSDDERTANETMMICVSRCLGERLVLDL